MGYTLHHFVKFVLFVSRLKGKPLHKERFEAVSGDTSDVESQQLLP